MRVYILVVLFIALRMHLCAQIPGVEEQNRQDTFELNPLKQVAKPIGYVNNLVSKTNVINQKIVSSTEVFIRRLQ